MSLIDQYPAESLQVFLYFLFFGFFFFNVVTPPPPPKFNPFFLQNLDENQLIED